ncbi:hypothetical protein BKA59DRAFT_175952 [Fusarium tricinctum]|uniref:DUF2306 domain-containing protein n=1 Tax=Fusarium tricinctum TaxID=61284 RepID=A0A8K0RYC1_9HYPO|nr:hypothetical protein BKA59DRAFT_175952 [Fusarium tricinctum]
MAALKQRLGFKTRSSLALFSIFGGALFLFSTLQLPYIDIDRVFYAAGNPWSVPGECYWFQKPGLMRNGMLLHLSTILPAGALICFQFIPALRQAKYAKFHRINGYVVLFLSALGTIGALIIEKRAMGGGSSNRIGTWILCTLFTGASIMGLVSIKRRRFEEHRAWMLRAWFWATSIITMRIILISMAHIIGTPSRAFEVSMPCYIVEYLHESFPGTMKNPYPSCAAFTSGENLLQETMVTTNWDLNDLPGITAGLRFGYAVGGWLGFVIHAIGVEVYIRATRPKRKVKV